MKSDVILLNYILAFYAGMPAVALPLDKFYPFDIETDDQVSLTVAGAASWIPLTKAFPFYNSSNSGGLYVSTMMTCHKNDVTFNKFTNIRPCC